MQLWLFLIFENWFLGNCWNFCFNCLKFFQNYCIFYVSIIFSGIRFPKRSARRILPDKHSIWRCTKENIPNWIRTAWLDWKRFLFLIYEKIHFRRKFKCLTKISIFDQKFDFWPKVWFLTKSLIFDQRLIFDQKLCFWPQVRFFTKSDIFDHNFFYQNLCDRLKILTSGESSDITYRSLGDVFWSTLLMRIVGICFGVFSCCIGTPLYSAIHFGIIFIALAIFSSRVIISPSLVSSLFSIFPVFSRSVFSCFLMSAFEYSILSHHLSSAFSSARYSSSVGKRSSVSTFVARDPNLEIYLKQNK